MKPAEEQNLIYKIINYGMGREDFTLRELFHELNIEHDGGTGIYIQRYLLAPRPDDVGPNHIFAEVQRYNIPDALDYRLRLLTSAVFQYEDYQELKAARQNAAQARVFSIIAILISILGLAVTGFQLYFQMNPVSFRDTISI